MTSKSYIPISGSRTTNSMQLISSVHSKYTIDMLYLWYARTIWIVRTHTDDMECAYY